MFDFEKLDVYQVVKEQNNKVLSFLKANNQIDQLLAEYWKKASLESVLNLTVGTGHKTTSEKKEFLINARSNIFKSVTILQILKDLEAIDEVTYMEYYENYEKASKMLLGIYRSYNRREKQHQAQTELQGQEETNYNI